MLARSITTGMTGALLDTHLARRSTDPATIGVIVSAALAGGRGTGEP